MDFTAFSTAPSGGSNANSLTGSLAFGVGGDHPNRHTPQQQRSTSNLSSPQPSAVNPIVFSTSATAMPNHNSNLNPAHLGTQFGTFHLSVAMDTPADSFDDSAMQSITQTLSVLQSIAEGKHLVQWNELLDPERPRESAAEVSDTLSTVPLVNRKEAIQAVARGITTPAHLGIVHFLEEPYRNEVRDLVLQELLGQLTRTGSEPMPVYAEMLAELARLNLVRLGGVAVAIEQFLSQPDKRRAGLAVLGRMAENDSQQTFLRAIQATKKVEPLLLELYRDPQYEYDVVAITRLLGSNLLSAGAGGNSEGNTEEATFSLQSHGTINTDSNAPVTTMQYFRTRDELVTGHGDGTVVVWGPPHKAGEVGPRVVLDLPNDCIPVAMSGPARGQYLAVAGMPCPVAGSSPYRPFLDARKTTHSRMPAPASGAHPVIRILSYQELTKNWTGVETIVLPAVTTVTAIAAMSNNTVCAGESTTNLSSQKAYLMQHDLRFHNAATGQQLHTIANAHTDYTTVLAACDENESVLLSGSRDRTVKLWDARSQSQTNTSNGGTSAPMFTLDTNAVHLDTISSILPFRYFLFTGSLDGTLCIWDTRRLSTPVATRGFMSGVLDVTAMEGGHIAVATARGLLLVSLETMGAVDVLPNEVYTQLRCSESGHVLFAAGQEGVSVFSTLRSSARESSA